MIADREPQVISILQGGSHKLYSWCIVSLVFAVLYSNPVFREVRETQYFTAGRTLGFCLTVAPLAGAWIETSVSIICLWIISWQSHPLRVRGLKPQGERG